MSLDAPRLTPVGAALVETAALNAGAAGFGGRNLSSSELSSPNKDAATDFAAGAKTLRWAAFSESCSDSKSLLQAECDRIEQDACICEETAVPLTKGWVWKKGSGKGLLQLPSTFVFDCSRA